LRAPFGSPTCSMCDSIALNARLKTHATQVLPASIIEALVRPGRPVLVERSAHRFLFGNFGDRHVPPALESGHPLLRVDHDVDERGAVVALRGLERFPERLLAAREVR